MLKIKFNSRWRFPKLSSDVLICCGRNATSYQNLLESILLLLPLPLFGSKVVTSHENPSECIRPAMIFGPPKKDFQSSNSSLHGLQAAALPDLLDFSPEVAETNFWGLHI